MDYSTVLKQQWLLMQSPNRNDHLHKVEIDNLIIEVNKFHQDGHKIIVTMDGNEAFLQRKEEYIFFVEYVNSLIHSTTDIVRSIMKGHT